MCSGQVGGQLPSGVTHSRQVDRHQHYRGAGIDLCIANHTFVKDGDLSLKYLVLLIQVRSQTVVLSGEDVGVVGSRPPRT